MFVESFIDTLRYVLQDERRIVGLFVDVHWNTVGFCEWLIKAVSHVQSNIKEIHDIFVNLNVYLQTMIIKYLLDLFLHNISLAASEPAVTKPVITVSSETDIEMLNSAEEKQANNITDLSSIITAHCHVKIFAGFLFVGSVVFVE